MKLISQVLILCLLFTPAITNAQKNVDFDKQNFKSDSDYEAFIEHIEAGDDYFGEGIEEANLALKEYLKANELYSNNAKLNYRLSTCYLYTNDLFQSSVYAQKAYDLDSLVDREILYRLAMGYQYKLQFDKAIQFYKRFLDEYKGCGKKKWKQRVKEKIQECENGRYNVKNFQPGLIRHLKRINSEYIDHSPLPSLDEKTVYFTSRRPVDTAKENPDLWIQGRFLERVFKAEKDENGIWQPATVVEELVSETDHIATVALSDDQKTMYLYKSSVNHGDLFVTYKTDTGWTEPAPLPKPINTKRYKETGISFTPDRKQVYFISNRPGGEGEKDIWVADVKKDDDGKEEYTNPRALSNVINTKKNERAVYIQRDGKAMFFSSQGHSSMGGFDIFKSTLDENGNWGEPVNMGYPINTAGNDIFFVQTKDGKRGYYSALKLNTVGEQDIYTYIFPDKDGNLPQDSTLLTGVIKDRDTDEPLLASVKFFDKDDSLVKEIHTNPETGKYKTKLPHVGEYRVLVSSDTYDDVEQGINVKKIDNKDFFMNKTLLFCKPIPIKDVWFDFDSYKLRPKSYETLDSLFVFLENCKGYDVKIAGHTCWLGSEAYNDILSNNRAKSVVDYLVSKGLDPNRFVWDGYGERYPIAPNTTLEGRRKNRRVEFVLFPKGSKDIVKPIKLYFDNDCPNPRTNKSVTKLNYEQTYTAYLDRKAIYKDEFSKGLTGDSKQEAIVSIEDFFSGKVENEFNKLKDMNASLKQLLEEGKSVELKIKGYASPLTTSSYNVNLSKRRISSVINYYRQVDNAVFAKYLKNNKLKIIEEAFGESEAPKEVSSNLDDLRNSVYNPLAASQRYVLISVTEVKK